MLVLPLTTACEHAKRHDGMSDLMARDAKTSDSISSTANSADSADRKPLIPKEMRDRWHHDLDLLTRLLSVPVGLVTRVDLPEAELFLSSTTDGFPFKTGMQLNMQAGTYCEKVLRERTRLLVSNALRSPEWQGNPQVKMGLTYYLGFPIQWPDGELFGTVCFLDTRDNTQATRFQQLVSQFGQLVEKDLKARIETIKHDKLMVELQRHRDHLEKMVAARTLELEKNKELLENRVEFESLVSDLSSSLMNVSADDMGDVICTALGNIRRSLRMDYCGFREALSDGLDNSFMLMYWEAGMRKEPLAELISRCPWSFHRLLEKRQPIVIASLDEFPPAASLDRKYWEEMGSQSVLMLPISLEGHTNHYIYLSSRRPLSWPPDLVRRLAFLGATIGKTILHKRAGQALRSAEAEIRAEQIRLRMTLEAAGMVTWEWNIPNGSITYHQNLSAIVRGEAVAPYCHLDSFLLEVHPEDRERLAQTLNRAVQQSSPWECEYRTRMLDGTYRWILGRGKIVEVNEAKPVRILGVSTDITERKREEQTLERAFLEIKKLKDKLQAETDYLKGEISELKDHGELIGRSKPFLKVLKEMEQVAATNASVVITGETGTGKEVIARRIHRLSRRGDRTMVCINCASLPAYLVESELFGREKGAYTGALTSQAGRFEIANGSTLFLDEVSDLPLEMQAKLLRVLQEGEFERLGSTKTLHSNVRIIAATNRDLRKAVAEGKFREDLFYRLNVYPIHVPPLRERPEDIPLLVKAFVAEFADRTGKTFERISEPAMQALKSYCWPGNVRELRNVIEHAVIVNEGSIFSIDFGSIGQSPSSEALTLERMEAAHIQTMLERASWRIKGCGGAAEMLGLKPSTLHSRMKKLGISGRLKKNAI